MSHFSITIYFSIMSHFSITSYLLLLHLLLFGALAMADQATPLSPMDETEQEALYSLIQSFVGKWFNGSELYPDPCGWTPIQGVSCDLFDGLWYITTITIGPLNDNSLRCSHTPEFNHLFFHLKHLKSLTFFDCFHHPISLPASRWLGLANTLETLEFRSNPGLIGKIPAEFASLARLQSLVLLENNLAGELPMGLGNLVELKQLVLAGNRLRGPIPSSLGCLSKLLIIDLSRNFLSGPLPTTIGGLISLLKLDLSNNSFDGKLPLEVGGLKNLTLLDLRNNRFSCGLPQSLQEMVSLEEMLLSNNLFGGDLRDLHWENLHNLIILEFSNMSLVGEIPASMAGMRKLRFLALDNNLLSGTVPPNLGDMPCVNAIYLHGNNLAGELQFSEDFYGKMGRHFAAWSNPNLCYNAQLVSKQKAPTRLKECPRKISLSNSGVKKLVGDERCGFEVGSCVISGYGMSGFWWVLVAMEMVAGFVLYLLI